VQEGVPAACSGEGERSRAESFALRNKRLHPAFPPQKSKNFSCLPCLAALQALEQGWLSAAGGGQQGEESSVKEELSTEEGQRAVAAIVLHKALYCLG